MEKLLSLLLCFGAGIVISIDQSTSYVITALLLFIASVYGLKGLLFE